MPGGWEEELVATPERISVREVKARLNRGEKVTFLDARSPDSWNKADAQIPGSLRVPPDEVDQHLREIPRDGLIVPYCT